MANKEQSDALTSTLASFNYEYDEIAEETINLDNNNIPIQHNDLYDQKL